MTGTLAPADIGIIILAAGSGVRFGADKRRAVMANGASLLDNTLSRVPASFSRRILVLRPGDDDLAERHACRWQICVAGDPASGMANSLASGIAMAGTWAGALVGLGDMPFIRPDTYAAVQNALCEHEIVIPGYGEARGNPVGFRRQFFGEMENLRGDRGARSLLKQYADRCHTLETGDEGILRDVDSPDGLAET